LPVSSFQFPLTAKSQRPTLVRLFGFSGNWKLETGNFFFCLLLLLATPQALADQYHSQVRAAPNEPAQQPQDVQKQLQATTDPYAKSMLLRELAEAAAQKKDYAAAAKYLQDALNQHGLSGPAEQQMRNDLAQLRMGSGDPQTVIAAIEPRYKSGAALAPEELVALGAAYLKQNRYREALPPLQKGVASTRTPDLSWRRALYAAYIGTGQEQPAAQLLETVVRDQPSAREDWLRLSALYLKGGNKERAQATMEVASRLGYLDSAEQRLQLVALTAQIGAPFQAGSLLKGWIEAGKVARNADSLRDLATLWVQARESSLAIPALQEAVAAKPGSELYLQLGQIHLDREEYREAAEALSQGISMGGKSGPAYMALGVALYQQADVDGATKAFHDAAAFPANRALANQWASYLQSGQAREQALTAAAQRRTLDTSMPTLATGLLGGPVAVGDAAQPQLPPAVAPGAAAGSSGLTPVGGEQAGSADGSIPPWTGGLTRSQWPASYRAGGKLPDPFPNDKPLFTITAANYHNYAEHLVDGYQALFAEFPDYTMPVYPTRRTASYPQAIYAATQANLGKSRTIAADSIADAHLGFPFAQPQSGVEVLWNHRLRYRGDTVQSQSTQAVVEASGSTELYRQSEKVYYRYGNVHDPVDIASHNILLYYLTWFSRDRNGLDFLALVHETANQLKDARAIWVAPANIPRMFRIPPVGYDQPFPASGGIYFIDMVDMYNGLFDRYVWKLIGKRELYVPYNAYRLNDGSIKYAQLLRPGHLNQASTRYELHRVWVVEASLRPGNNHRFGKRLFYVDEDSWNVLLVVNYDHDGSAWRFQEGHLLPAYDEQAANCAPVVTYDLKDGRYFANRLYSEDAAPVYDKQMTEGEFMPDVVKSRYIH
jgi:tetratricopeptide (TPR) repeat protein